MKKIIAYGLSLTLIFCILSLSLQDAPASNALSTSLTERIWHTLHESFPNLAAKLPGSIGAFNNLIREFAHILEYLILSICILFAFDLTCSWRKSIWYTSVSILWIALLDEFIQYAFSPGRAFQVIDLAKDWLGLGLAILLYVSLKALYQRYTPTKPRSTIHYYKK